MNPDTKITEYIEQLIVEWQGKTLSSNEHFVSELRKTLLEVAIFVKKHK